MRAIYVALLGVCLGMGASNLKAAQIAFDSAGDSAYNTFPTNSYPNGGYGWGGPWQGYGLLIGSSSLNGFGDPQGTGDINSPRTPAGRAWRVPATLTPDFYSFVWRQFSSPLLPGQTFAIDLDTGANHGPNLPQGFDIAQGVTDFESRTTGFRFAADPQDYADYAVGTAQAGYVTSVPLTDQGVHVEVTQLAGSQIGVSITSLAPGGASQSLVLPVNVPLTTLTVSNPASGAGFDGENSDLYMNNISITPEPTSVVMLPLVFAGAALTRRRRCVQQDRVSR